MFILLNIVAVLVNFLMKIASTAQLFMYTRWPRKNARPTITNCTEIRDSIKLVSALKRRNFVFQQIETNIIDFDEGALISEAM